MLYIRIQNKSPGTGGRHKYCNEYWNLLSRDARSVFSMIVTATSINYLIIMHISSQLEESHAMLRKSFVSTLSLSVAGMCMCCETMTF